MEIIVFFMMLWIARQCFQYALSLLAKMMGIDTKKKVNQND